jgi:hypothetical protein
MHQAPGGLLQAVAIGVGFHHRDVFHLRWQGGADAFEVALQRGQIDFGPATLGQ